MAGPAAGRRAAGSARRPDVFQQGGPCSPEEMQPLDAAFFDLPERLLDEERPLLDRIIAAGDRLAEEVDRVVVLGIGGSYMGARAMFEACCHPYHNEISRAAARRPAADLLRGQQRRQRRRAGPVGFGRRHDDWGIVVISKSGGTLETAVGLPHLLRRPAEGVRRRRREAPPPGRRRSPAGTGRLSELAAALGCPDVFPIPDGVGGRFSVSAPWACCRRP